MRYTPYVGQPNPSHMGTLEAEVLILIDAPNKKGEEYNQPFSSPQLDTLYELMNFGGLAPHSVRIESIMPFREASPASQYMFNSSQEAMRRLAVMPNLKVIVPMGNVGTTLLTGKGKASPDWRRMMGIRDKEFVVDITNLRGNVWEFGPFIVIPTLEPFMCYGSPMMQKNKRRMAADWAKVGQALKPNFLPPAYDIIINPSIDQVMDFACYVIEHPTEPVAVDIETWGNKLDCVGFAINKDGTQHSITLRTETVTLFERFVPFVKGLLALPNPKVLANGLFDRYWLKWYGIEMINYLWDVQSLHHTLHATDNHSLAYLASLYLRRPYWKDTGKGDDMAGFDTQKEAKWQYNGLDCCATLEMLPALIAEVTENGMLNFYHASYSSFYPILGDMMNQGVLIDLEQQEAAKADLDADADELQQNITAYVGTNLFSTKTHTIYREATADERSLLTTGPDWPPTKKQLNKDGLAALASKGLKYFQGGAKAGTIAEKIETTGTGISNKKLIAYFEGQGIPIPQKRRKGADDPTDCLDEGAMRKLMIKAPATEEILNMLLLYKSMRKEAEYFNHCWDDDNRIRCSYKQTTEAGRLASSQNPRRTGLNLQNLKR